MAKSLNELVSATKKAKKLMFKSAKDYQIARNRLINKLIEEDTVTKKPALYVKIVKDL